MIRLENVKVGEYEFLQGKTFVLANARDVSFYIADNTPQKLKLTFRLLETSDNQDSFRPEENDNHNLRIVIPCIPGEKFFSKEFVRIGTFDVDAKPLYMSFYSSALNEVSRILVLNFYTLKHGEDIG